MISKRYGDWIEKYVVVKHNLWWFERRWNKFNCWLAIKTYNRFKAVLIVTKGTMGF